jgi:hypothetical protein
VIAYSKDAEADRTFFRGVLHFGSVDAGHGRLIFALPKSELAVHPSDENDAHELFFVCDVCDGIRAFVAEMTRHPSPARAHGRGYTLRATIQCRIRSPGEPI